MENGRRILKKISDRIRVYYTKRINFLIIQRISKTYFFQTASKGKQTLQKLKDLKNPYNFQYYFEKRCESLQAYVQKMNAR